MEFFSADTLSSSSHTAPSGAWFTLSRPSLSRYPSSPSWLTSSDSLDPTFIALCPPPDYPHIRFARNNALQRGHSHLLCTDSLCSPSSSSPSKSTIPLSEAEEAGEFPPLYSTHLVGILDSPPVMRRVDLVSHKPLTPPPTVPHPALNLPDADFDMPFYYDHQVEGIEEDSNTDESYPGPSKHPSPHFAQPSLPLSPLSPSWDPPCPQELSIDDFPDSNTLFSVSNSSVLPALEYCHPSPRSPHEPSSLLDVDIDAPRPLLAPISIPWPSESDPEPPYSSSTSSCSFASLTDYDKLSPPSSPLVSRLDLPDLEDDGVPKIFPSSPSRRSFSGLPDSDMETSGDPTSDIVPALPGQPLLSLPGAETDDDLIPRIAPSRLLPFAPPSQPLLFIDDPRDVPLPRSPSPEDFDLSLSPEDITDPEFAKLFDLRKRSIAAERAARRLESLTEDVDLFTRAEAHKIRKRERERCKEVGALLRLKLGDGIAMYPAQEQHSPPSSECDRDRERDRDRDQVRRRAVIGSMSQLVAQMVFRRNERSRPLAKRKTAASGAREYVRSALSATASE